MRFQAPEITLDHDLRDHLRLALRHANLLQHLRAGPTEPFRGDENRVPFHDGLPPWLRDDLDNNLDIPEFLQKTTC